MARSKVITVEIAEQQIQTWELIRDILLRIPETNEDDGNTRIIKKYLKYGSVATVATEMNNEGYRKINESTGQPRKLSSNDISEVIRDGEIADKEMQALARMILDDHTAFINRIFN